MHIIIMIYHDIIRLNASALWASGSFQAKVKNSWFKLFSLKLIENPHKILCIRPIKNQEWFWKRTWRNDVLWFSMGNYTIWLCLILSFTFSDIESDLIILAALISLTISRNVILDWSNSGRYCIPWQNGRGESDLALKI